MYRFLGWVLLIGVFLLILTVGLITAQSKEQIVPMYETVDGEIVALDLSSVQRGTGEQKDFIAFRSRVIVGFLDYTTSGVIANCKDKNYMFIFHEYVKGTEEDFQIPDPPVRTKSIKKTPMRSLINDICKATKPKKS